MMEERIRAQCSDKDDVGLMLARVLDSEERWPDTEYDDQRGVQIVFDWTYVGDAADYIEFAFPEWGPTPGNDYPNVVHFIKERCGIGLPGYPDRELTWDPDSVEWLESA